MHGQNKAQGLVPWAGLVAILALYVVMVVRLHPTNFFGLTQDDSIYFSSAQALAQGKGYILPNLPWSPPATKYPILYPWLLSWVWRVHPTFPDNLKLGIGMTVAFGLGYITLAFLFFRQLKLLNHAEVLLLTAFCATQPVVLFYSAQLMTEIPFSTLALAAMVSGQTAMQKDAKPGLAAGCGVLGGLSVLLRVLGVPILAGILVAALVRKAWRQAAVFAVAVAPFFGWQVWKAIESARLSQSAPVLNTGPGFQQTWTYYMSYIAMRNLNGGGPGMFASMVGTQAIYLLTHVPGFFLGSLLDAHIGLLFVATLALLSAVCVGIALISRERSWQPVICALPFYVALILLWDYPEIQRFLLPFLPLLAAGLWLAGRSGTAKLKEALQYARHSLEKFALIMMGLGAALLGAAVLWNFVVSRDRSELRQLSDKRAALLIEKREAYNWIRDTAPWDARTVAGEDACAYLYTGRQSMSFIALSRLGAFDPERLQFDLDHVSDVAQAIDAQYWVAAPDDSDKQWTSAKVALGKRYGQIEGALLELFRSGAGHVRIYDLHCVRQPDDPSCSAANPVLFPANAAAVRHSGRMSEAIGNSVSDNQ